MKRMYSILALLILLSSCEVVVIAPVDPRDRLLGSYRVSEYSETYDIEVNFPITISKVSQDGESIRIHNFYDVDITAFGYLIGDRIRIPYQIVDGYEIQGSGTVFGNEIDFEYSVFDTYIGGYVDYCLATAY